MTHIDTMIRRYHGRSFGYYFLRTDWLSVLTMAMVVAVGVMVNWWWYWLILVTLNATAFGYNVRAARRAWWALQAAGDTLAEIDAYLARRAS